MEVAKNLFETLKQLCLILNKSDIYYCLIGGLAVGMVSRPRATEDIDLLVLLNEQDRGSIVNLLRDEFELIQDDNVMNFKDTTILRVVIRESHKKDKSLVIVDFIFANNAIYKKAVYNPIKLIVDGITIPVASPENLIETKKLSNHPQDLLDIQAIREEYKNL